jgi:cell division inhibitor SepF
MASGLMKKTMVYLGLVDDEYDEADGYEPWAPPATRQVARVATEESEEQPATVSSGATIRPLTREQVGASAAAVVAPARTSVVKPLPSDSGPGPKVHVVAPKEFTDGKTIADKLVSIQPVIVNLQLADRDLMRRIIDFCSGVAYAIGGKMERVADKVFLVTPQNVRVSPEERQRLQENGLVRV